jgi:hypothetical protein
MWLVNKVLSFFGNEKAAAMLEIEELADKIEKCTDPNALQGLIDKQADLFNKNIWLLTDLKPMLKRKFKAIEENFGCSKFQEDCSTDYFKSNIREYIAAPALKAVLNMNKNNALTGENYTWDVNLCVYPFLSSMGVEGDGYKKHSDLAMPFSSTINFSRHNGEEFLYTKNKADKNNSVGFMGWNPYSPVVDLSTNAVYFPSLEGKAMTQTHIYRITDEYKTTFPFFAPPRVVNKSIECLADFMYYKGIGIKRTEDEGEENFQNPKGEYDKLTNPISYVIDIKSFSSGVKIGWELVAAFIRKIKQDNEGNQRPIHISLDCAQLAPLADSKEATFPWVPTWALQAGISVLGYHHFSTVEAIEECSKAMDEFIDEKTNRIIAMNVKTSYSTVDKYVPDHHKKVVVEISKLQKNNIKIDQELYESTELPHLRIDGSKYFQQNNEPQEIIKKWQKEIQPPPINLHNLQPQQQPQSMLEIKEEESVESPFHSISSNKSLQIQK